MSDYRNPNSDYRSPDYRSADDPSRRRPGGDLDTGAASAAWGWIAAAVFAVIVIAAAFTLGHGPNQGGTNTASNEPQPPVTSPMAPPPASTMTPPANPAAPLSPSPNTPAGRGDPQR
jgi:hypothetical protein